MNLERMLNMCRRDQWRAEALDWSQKPRAMRPEEEEAVVQYFTNMAGIERLAGALFREQGRRAESETLREVFASFVEDEMRHADVAERLAQHYNVHRYRDYQPDPNLVKFAPAFVDAIRYLTPEIANVYITTGEIILDVALLRSLNDYVDDRLADEAMALINRDESRHIAVDFHMVEHYSSDAYVQSLGSAPKAPLPTRLRGYVALGRVLFHARPFLSAVFFEPMRLVDPSGARLREAFKRIQLLAAKPAVRRRPFVRFMNGMQDLFNMPVVGVVFGRVLVRIVGVDPEVLQRLYTEDEQAYAARASFDALAQETLALKFV